MSDFLWHRIDEKEKEEIRKNSRQIMDDFSEKLKAVDKIDSEPFVEREKGERQEGEEVEGDGFSRDIMFENAPNKNKDFIIAEKKNWGEK